MQVRENGRVMMRPSPPLCGSGSVRTKKRLNRSVSWTGGGWSNETDKRESSSSHLSASSGASGCFRRVKRRDLLDQAVTSGGWAEWERA
jgi:hypothetical protein